MQKKDKKKEKNYERDRKGRRGPVGTTMSRRSQAATVEDEDDLPACLARGHPRCDGRQCRQQSHNQGESKMAA